MNIPALFALALALGGGAALAQEATTPLPMPVQEPSRNQLLDTYHEKGTVMAVDAVTGKLRVKDERGKIRRFFAKRAKVSTVEGKIIALADISVGDEVSISYKISPKGKDATEILRHHKAAKR